MGDFNIACGLSNLEIQEDDRVGVVILDHIEAHNYSDYGYSAAKLFDTEPTKNYRPHLPAVYAHYNGSGGFRDVEESGVTRYLEEYLKKPILDVLNAIGDRRKLYDEHSKVGNLYLEPRLRKVLRNNKLTVEQKLVSFGFAKVNPKLDELKAYSHKSIRLALLDSNGDRQLWRASEGSDLRFERSFHGDAADILSILSSTSYCAPGFADPALALTVRRFSGMTFLPEVLDSVSDLVESQRYYSDRLNLLTEELEKFFLFELSPEFLSAVRNLNDQGPQAVARLYLQHARSDYVESELIVPRQQLESFRSLLTAEEVLSLKKLEFALFALNRRFEPTMVAEENNSDRATLVLNKAVDAIIRQRMYDRDEDPDEIF